MTLWRPLKMANNGNLDVHTQELSDIQSKLESCGKEYLKLASELVALTSTLSTQPTVHYQTLKKLLDYQLEALTSVTRYTSQQVKSAQQSAVSPPSTLKPMTSGEIQEWFKTWSDSWTMSLNSLSDTLRKN